MTKREIYAKAEVAMMGKLVELRVDEISTFEEYVLNTLGVAPLDLAPMERVNQYNNDNKMLIRYATVNLIQGMPCITYLLSYKLHEKPNHPDFDWEYDFPNPLEDESNGYATAFCWVENLSEPLFSELGTCTFEKVGTSFHRIA